MKASNVATFGLLSSIFMSAAFADAARNYPQPTQAVSSFGGVPETVVSTSVAPVVTKHQGKTRAEVRQELIQAQRDGLIPHTESDYPPSERTIERNKARYSAVERHIE